MDIFTIFAVAFLIYVAIIALTDHEAYERRAAKRNGSMPIEHKAAEPQPNKRQFHREDAK